VLAAKHVVRGVMLAGAAGLVGLVAGLALASPLRVWASGGYGPEGAGLKCINRGRVCVGMPAEVAFSASRVPGGLAAVSCGPKSAAGGAPTDQQLFVGELIAKGCPKVEYTAAFDSAHHEIYVRVRSGVVVEINRYRHPKAPAERPLP
jgi:hypothetical protein